MLLSRAIRLIYSFCRIFLALDRCFFPNPRSISISANACCSCFWPLESQYCMSLASWSLAIAVLLWPLLNLSMLSYPPVFVSRMKFIAQIGILVKKITRLLLRCKSAMFTSWHGITRWYEAHKPCFVNSHVLNVCSIASTTSFLSVSTRLVGLVVQVPFVWLFITLTFSLIGAFLWSTYLPIGHDFVILECKCFLLLVTICSMHCSPLDGARNGRGTTAALQILSPLAFNLIHLYHLNNILTFHLNCKSWSLFPPSSEPLFSPWHHHQNHYSHPSSEPLALFSPSSALYCKSQCTARVCRAVYLTSINTSTSSSHDTWFPKWVAQEFTDISTTVALRILSPLTFNLIHLYHLIMPHQNHNSHHHQYHYSYHRRWYHWHYSHHHQNPPRSLGYMPQQQYHGHPTVQAHQHRQPAQQGWRRWW